MLYSTDSAMKFVGLYHKDGKLKALVSLFLSLYFSLISYSLQSMVADRIIHMMLTFHQYFFPYPTVSNPFHLTVVHNQLRQDFTILFSLKLMFLLPSTIIVLFNTFSTVLISTTPLNKLLFSTILKTWVRPLITAFHVACIWIGYCVFAMTLIAALLLMRPELATPVGAFLVGITTSIFYLYLSVPWILSIVVAVVDEEGCYGLEAIEKGAVLVKGTRLHGFLLNIFFNLVFVIIFQGYKILGEHLPPTICTLLISVVSLVKVLQVIAYLVFYSRCKEIHGEEIGVMW